MFTLKSWVSTQSGQRPWLAGVKLDEVFMLKLFGFGKDASAHSDRRQPVTSDPSPSQGAAAYLLCVTSRIHSTKS